MLDMPRRMDNYQNHVKDFQICKQHVNKESLREEAMVQWEGQWGVSASEAEHIRD